MAKQPKSKRRILHKIQLTEISAVDRPCQEHAKMTIMKRASAPVASVQTLESQDAGDLAKALRTAMFEFTAQEARTVIDKAWEESKHPRDNDGKFSGPGKITASRVIRGASAGLAAGTVGMVFGGPVAAALLAGVTAVLVGGPDTGPDMRAAMNAIKASLSVTTANKDGKIITSKEIVQNVVKKLTNAGWSQEKANAIAIKAVDAVHKEINKESKLRTKVARKAENMNKAKPSDDSKAVNEAIAFLSAMLDELESMQEDGNNEVKKFNSITRNANRVLTKVYA